MSVDRRLLGGRAHDRQPHRSRSAWSRGRAPRSGRAGSILLGIFVILTVSLNLVSGFTGLFSLGHIGFMALGVYISAILTLSLEKKASLLPDLPGWLAGLSLSQMVGPFPVGWLVATLIAGLLVSLIALAVGAVIMRLSGNFVAVATLGFLVIVRVILINADSLTRGSRTFSGVTPFTDLWWTWGWAVVTIYVVWRIKRSPGDARCSPSGPTSGRPSRWASRSSDHDCWPSSSAPSSAPSRDRCTPTSSRRSRRASSTSTSRSRSSRCSWWAASAP